MGSRMGWILAAVLSAALAGLFLKIVVFPSPTGATSRTLRQGALDLAWQAMQPKDVTGRDMDASGNAGGFYSHAMEICRDNRQAIAELFSRVNLASLKAGQEVLSTADARLPAGIAEQVQQGARRRQMRFVPEYAPKIEIASDLPAADDLQDLAKALWLYAAAMTGEKDYAQAERTYGDALTMGYHFACERARVSLVRRGLALQKAACDSLKELYTKFWAERADRVARLDEFAATVLAVSDRYADKLTTVRNIGVWRDTPGDIFNIAANDKDRAWRVEGILTLGLVKYAGATRGDQRHAKALIRKYLKSDDPVEAAAARAADELTLEQYRGLSSQIR